MMNSRRKGWFLYGERENLITPLQNDRDVVLAALREDGFTLEHASAALRDDRAVVKVSVAKYGCAIRYASERLRADRDLVLFAMTPRGFVGSALQYASWDLRADRAFLFEAVGVCRLAIHHAAGNLRNDPELNAAARTLPNLYTTR